MQTCRPSQANQTATPGSAGRLPEFEVSGLRSMLLDKTGNSIFLPLSLANSSRLFLTLRKAVSKLVLNDPQTRPCFQRGKPGGHCKGKACACGAERSAVMIATPLSERARGRPGRAWP